MMIKAKQNKNKKNAKKTQKAEHKKYCGAQDYKITYFDQYNSPYD